MGVVRQPKCVNALMYLSTLAIIVVVVVVGVVVLVVVLVLVLVFVLVLVLAVVGSRRCSFGHWF